MTFEEAVRVVEDFGADCYGIRRGLLLDSLYKLRDDLAEENDDPYFVSQEQIAAYRIVCREMRKLFV